MGDLGEFVDGDTVKADRREGYRYRKTLRDAGLILLFLFKACACGVCVRSRVLCVCVSCRLLGTCELTNLSNLSGRPAIIYKWISFSENLNIVKKFDILDSRVAF